MKKYKLGEILDFFNGKQRPKNIGKYPLYGGNGIIDYVDEYNYDDNIIIGRVGANCGCVQICNEKCWVSDNAISVKVKSDFDKQYIFQLLKTLNLNTKHVGAAQPLITQNILSELIVRVPPLESQQKIAAVLSALDDKIALNRRMNAKLELMAKRLYDHWFVQFNFPFDFAQGKPDAGGTVGERSRTKPYKASGGKMEYNEVLKREIPAGWEVKSVNDISISYRGVGYSADDEKSVNDKDVVLVLRGNNISNNHIVYDSNTVYLDKSFVSEEQKINKFDIVMTMSSGSKEHVGKSAMFLFDSPHSYGAFCNKITPNKECQFFLENYLHSEFFKKYIKVTCSGTGINNLTNEHFDKALFAFPTEKLLKIFNEKVEPIYEQMGILEKENQKLTALRDRLLPLLMNGQVEMK